MDCNTVIEGCVKFRDGKKWKSRWCVMRKLSPVADCLHLQLYRDSKDRYKQGHTKASLSLQQFLGYETGFTLDKESNTIAIICHDVIVVVAFDTRETLIQWQVKISNNLGQDQQFLIQISSSPPKAKLSSGPARLHVQQGKFCITIGVPPKLIGIWEIQHLRRFGVLDGKFCFEGGSRCGKGEGLYVLLTDQGNEITKYLQLASEGKLECKGRPLSFGKDIDIGSDSSLDGNRIIANDNNSVWCWTESQRNVNIYGHGDTTSLGDLSLDVSNNSQGCSSMWSGEGTLGRCVSCIEKLGTTSGANTPGSITYNPLTMLIDSLQYNNNTMGENERNTMTYYHHHRCSCSQNQMLHMDMDAERPPSRPPKPEKYKNSDSIKTMNTLRKLKPPFPLPFNENNEETCGSNRMKVINDEKCSDNNNYYYDTPNIMTFKNKKDDFKYYDTPRNILAGQRQQQQQQQMAYGNYDIPPAAIPVKNINTRNNCRSQRNNNNDDDDDSNVLYSHNQIRVQSPSCNCLLTNSQNESKMSFNDELIRERKCSDLYAVVDMSKKNKNKCKEQNKSNANYTNIQYYKDAINSLNYVNLEFGKKYESDDDDTKESCILLDSLNIELPNNENKDNNMTMINNNNGNNGDYMFMSPGNCLNKSASNPSLSQNITPRYRKISVNDCTGYDTLVKRRNELQHNNNNNKKILRPDAFRKLSNVSNRDSSSSNDSGFSTSSLKHNQCITTDFETAKSPKRHYSFNQHYLNKKQSQSQCASIPQRSKSTDPFGDFTFQFPKYKYDVKSSPSCLNNTCRYYKDSSVITSASTSSGTSDMSDYIETLSISSHSSSEQQTDASRLQNELTTSMKPRSGNEYQKIDRISLVNQSKCDTIDTSNR